MPHGPEFAKLCMDYTTGGLTVKDVAHMEEHLSQCNDCQSRMEEFRQILASGFELSPDDLGKEREDRKKRLLALVREFDHDEHRRDATTSRRPGALLNSLADFFCSPKTRERVVEPIISDMQVEFSNAVAQNRKGGAVWIRIRGYWSLWTALSVHIVKKNLAKMLRISGIG